MCVLAVNGLEDKEKPTTALDVESDDDADGQSVDPTRAKPKVRDGKTWASFPLVDQTPGRGNCFPSDQAQGNCGLLCSSFTKPIVGEMLFPLGPSPGKTWASIPFTKPMVEETLFSL